MNPLCGMQQASGDRPRWGRGRTRRDTRMAVSVDLTKALDKAYEDKSIAEILAAPPSALAGLTEKHDAVLAEALGINTIADLGSNKYVSLAAALVALGSKTG